LVKITCYDGVNTIGGNKILLEDGGSAIFLDFGKSFSDSGRFFDEFLQPRTNSALRDLIRLGLMPAIPGIYRRDLLSLPGAWDRARENGAPESARSLWESNIESYEDYFDRFGSPRIDAVLLSHGHTDHFQHICFLSPEIPIYGSPVTGAILRVCQETGRGGFEGDVWACPSRVCGETKAGTFPGAAKIDREDRCRLRNYMELAPFQRLRIGAFEVEAAPVDHSVPGAYAYIITCPSGKTVFYTGDLRFHGRLSLPPFKITEELRERVRSLGPDVVITEGTRIDSDSRDSESDVERNIQELVSNCNGLAMVDFGWKDTTRFETLLSVARATKRTIAINPKIALLWEYLRKIDPERYHDLASDPNVRIYVERRDSMLYSLSDYSNGKYIAGVDIDWGERAQGMKEAYSTGDEEYLSPRLRHYRGGVRAYDISNNPKDYILHAGYFDMNELFDIEPPRGSVFIRAATEPFNVEMELDEDRLKNWLSYFGLMTDADHLIRHHVSGHASGEDLCQFIADMQPKAIIPIHTTKPEIYVDKFSQTCDVIVPAKGQEIVL
jgi:ribonuclease J